MRKKTVYLILVTLGVSLILLVALRRYDVHADRMEWMLGFIAADKPRCVWARHRGQAA